MKNILLLKLIFALIAFSSCKSQNQTIIIGNQEWMLNNLNVNKFRNGDPITEAITNEEWVRANNEKKPAWCYYENNTENEIKYGKLYNWYAINDPRGLAPKGWHIPDDEEWTQLTDFLTQKSDSSIAIKMKTSSGWLDNGNGNNLSGLSAFPGGYRASNGEFKGLGTSGMWWTSSEIDEDRAWFRYLYSYFDFVTRFSRFKNNGLSVRCIKDK